MQILAHLVNSCCETYCYAFLFMDVRNFANNLQKNMHVPFNWSEFSVLHLRPYMCTVHCRKHNLKHLSHTYLDNTYWLNNKLNLRSIESYKKSHKCSLLTHFWVNFYGRRHCHGISISFEPIVFFCVCVLF